MSAGTEPQAGPHPPRSAPRRPRRHAASGSERSLVLSAFAVSGGTWGALAVLLPALQASVGASDGQLGLALGALAVAALPVMPLAGRLADRLGAGEALQLALVASALTLPLPALAGSLPGLVGAFALLGLTTGALDVVANTAAAEWERHEHASGGQLMSLAHAGFSFGVVGGSVAVGLARQGGVGALPLLLLVAALTAAVAARVTGHRPPAPVPASTEPSPRRSRLPLLLVGAVIAAGFLVEDGLQSWSALHLERGLDAGPAVSGFGTALFGGAMGAGRLLAHALGRRVSETALLAGGGLLSAGGIILLAATAEPTVALGGLALAGAGTSVLAPVLFHAVGRWAEPGRQGGDLATVNALGYGGFVAGPPLVGAVSSVTSLPVALGALAGVALVVAVAGPLALRAGRPAGQPR